MEDDQIRQIKEEVIAPRCNDFEIYVAVPALSTIGFPVAKAEGFYLWDELGYQYLDFAGGDGAVVGHRAPVLMTSLGDQLRHYDYSGQYGQQIPRRQVEYAKAISQRFPEDHGIPKQVLFLNSHLEANTVAQQQLCGTRLELLGTRGELKDGGEIQDSYTLIRATGKPVIIDETRTDFGRTGKFLLQEHFGIPADITILGPAGGGGLPFAAVVASRKILAANLLIDGYAGNPLVMALGNALIGLYTQEVLDHVTNLGNVFEEGIKGLTNQWPDLIRSFNGIGLVRQLVLQDRTLNGRFFMACYAKGLLIHPDLRLTPPLCVSDVEIKRCVDIFADVLMDM